MNDDINKNLSSKDEKNPGFRAALYFQLPKIDDRLKEISEGVENLKLNSNFITPNMTPRTSDPKTIEYYKNCISIDLLKRLEEGSPLKCNTPGLDRKISEIFLMNCDKDEMNFYNENINKIINTNILGEREENIQNLRKSSKDETSEIFFDENLKNFNQKTKNYLPKTKMTEDCNIQNNSKIESFFDDNYESGKAAIPIYFKINRSESPRINKPIKYADSKSSPIYNYYNDSSEYFSQFFAGNYNNNNVIEKYNPINNDVLKIERFGIMDNENNSNLNNKKFNNYYSDENTENFKGFTKLDYNEYNNLNNNMKNNNDFKSSFNNSMNLDNSNNNISGNNNNDYINLEENNASNNINDRFKNYPILNKLPQKNIDLNKKREKEEQNNKIIINGKSLNNSTNEIKEDNQNDIKSSEIERGINNSIKEESNNIDNKTPINQSKNSGNFRKLNYIRAQKEMINGFIPNNNSNNSLTNIHADGYFTIPSKNGNNKTDANMKSPNGNFMNFNNNNGKQNDRNYFNYMNLLQNFNFLPENLNNMNSIFKINNNYLNGDVIENGNDKNFYNNNINYKNHQINNPNFDLNYNEQIKNQFWKKNFGKKKNPYNNYSSGNKNSDENNNDGNIYQNSNYTSKFDPEEYIVEMFGKRGWICDACNNFNYESKFGNFSFIILINYCFIIFFKS